MSKEKEPIKGNDYTIHFYNNVLLKWKIKITPIFDNALITELEREKHLTDKYKFTKEENLTRKIFENVDRKKDD